MQIKPVRQSAGGKVRLYPLQSCHGRVHAPQQRCFPQPMVRRRQLKRRRTEDAHLLLRRRARACPLQPFVPVHPQRRRISVRLMHPIHVGENIARHRLVEVLRKRLAIRIRAQILRIRNHPRLLGEIIAGRDRRVLAPLIHIDPTRVIPTIEQAVVVCPDKVIAQPPIPERPTLLPSAA